MKVRKHVWISGIVQGVFFRRFTWEHARRLGVTGWVRNLMDGRVEAVLEGEEDAVKTLIERLHEGPPAAHVTHVEVVDEPYTGEFEDFEIRYF